MLSLPFIAQVEHLSFFCLPLGGEKQTLRANCWFCCLSVLSRPLLLLVIYSSFRGDEDVRIYTGQAYKGSRYTATTRAAHDPPYTGLVRTTPSEQNARSFYLLWTFESLSASQLHIQGVSPTPYASILIKLSVTEKFCFPRVTHVFSYLSDQVSLFPGTLTNHLSILSLSFILKVRSSHLS